VIIPGLMTAAETASDLSSFTGRRGGSDAERRAALWLSDRLRSQGRAATIETFWCRPNWALAHAWHAVLGLGASVLIVSQPRIGGVLALVTVASIALDAATGRSLGRRLTPERASQNVVALDPAGTPGVTRVIVTANYDAGRAGLVYRAAPRVLAATLRRAGAGGRLSLGWLGWLTIALLWLVVIAIARNAGSSGTVIDIVQLVPSIGLLIAIVALVELGLSPPSPAASDNAAGVAVALAAIAALDARADGSAAADLVLQGSSDRDPVGLRRYLSRDGAARERPIVLGIAASGSGSPRWWRSDGPLWPLGYDRRLRELAADVYPATGGHRGRGTTPALGARAAGLRAIAIGCLDDRGVAPRSHLRTDTPEQLDPSSIDATTRAAVAIITAIERTIAPRTSAVID
jgi:hypothetical protein